MAQEVEYIRELAFKLTLTGRVCICHYRGCSVSEEQSRI